MDCSTPQAMAAGANPPGQGMAIVISTEYLQQKTNHIIISSYHHIKDDIRWLFQWAIDHTYSDVMEVGPTSEDPWHVVTSNSIYIYIYMRMSEKSEPSENVKDM